MRLPENVARRIEAVLAAGLTGQITLDVKEGQVMIVRITDYWHIKDGTAVKSPPRRNPVASRSHVC